MRQPLQRFWRMLLSWETLVDVTIVLVSIIAFRSLYEPFAAEGPFTTDKIFATDESVVAIRGGIGIGIESSDTIEIDRASVYNSMTATMIMICLPVLLGVSFATFRRSVTLERKVASYAAKILPARSDEFLRIRRKRRPGLLLSMWIVFALVWLLLMMCFVPSSVKVIAWMYVLVWGVFGLVSSGGPRMMAVMDMVDALDDSLEPNHARHTKTR